MTISNKDSKKVIALVQVRTNSTRLEKKQFLPIGDKMLIEWVVLRLQGLKKKNIDIVFCIPLGIDDDSLEELLLRNNQIVYRGSENDVLSRLYEGAKSLDYE